MPSDILVIVFAPTHLNLPPPDLDMVRATAVATAHSIDQRQSHQETKLSITGIAATSATDVAAAIDSVKPSLVHIKDYGLWYEDLVALSEAVVRDESPSVKALILERCFTLEIGELLADHIPAVVGINGPFTQPFLDQFYWVYLSQPKDAIYRAFASAHWTITEAINATLRPEDQPHFLTRDFVTMPQHAGFGITGGPPVPAVSQPVHPNEEAVAYPLFFGTNRQRVDSNDSTTGYSGERGTHVQFGTCTVNVPRSHRIGELGSPWWKRLLMLRPEDRLRLDWSSLKELEPVAYWNLIREQIDTNLESLPVHMIYIHGYNVSFELAALRAAQLGADLKIDGVMAFFSWPSKGKFSGYMADEATIDDSEEALTAYLTQLAGAVGNGRLNIIAHSMGNRALMRAMKEMFDRIASTAGVRFGQVFLAAPDVDASKFIKVGPVYPSMSVRTTLYVSSKDKALASSGFLHDYPRAGFVPPVTVIQGIDTIDTSGVDLTFLGHGYFAATRNVLRDMFTLLRRNSPPLERQGLFRKELSNGMPYWLLPVYDEPSVEY